MDWRDGKDWRGWRDGEAGNGRCVFIVVLVLLARLSYENDSCYEAKANTNAQFMWWY